MRTKHNLAQPSIPRSGGDETYLRQTKKKKECMNFEFESAD